MLRIFLCVSLKAQIDSEAHHDWPAVDAHSGLEGCGQQHEQQQREEESGAADKLEGVETKAGGADLDQLLQEQGHQGQQLEEYKQKNNLSHCTSCSREWRSYCPAPQLPV